MQKINRLQVPDDFQLSQLLNVVAKSFASYESLTRHFINFFEAKAKSRRLAQLKDVSPESLTLEYIQRNISAKQPIWRLIIFLDQAAAQYFLSSSYWKRVSHCASVEFAAEWLNLMEAILTTLWIWRSKSKSSLPSSSAKSICLSIAMLIEGLCLNVQGRKISQNKEYSWKSNSNRLLEILSSLDNRLADKTSKEYLFVAKHLNGKKPAEADENEFSIPFALIDAKERNEAVLVWTKRLMIILINDVALADRDELGEMNRLFQKALLGCEELQKVLDVLLCLLNKRNFNLPFRAEILGCLP